MSMVSSIADLDRGRTAFFHVTRDEVLSSWRELVEPTEKSRSIHHGTSGSRTPDTVVVCMEEREIALADAFAHTIENQYCYDAEYYLVLRLRTLIDARAWGELPWAALGPGDVFYAWDKFHHIDYSRTAAVVEAEKAMSYGGDWADLQSLIENAHPLPEAATTRTAPSDATLLRAVRAGDVAHVRALLAAGANPNAGAVAPDDALRPVSVNRDSSALWEAVAAGSCEIVEALLAAGASVQGTRGGWMTPLHGALVNRQFAVVPLLLRFGADPEDIYHGRSAVEVARTLDSATAALLEGHVTARR